MRARSCQRRPFVTHYVGSKDEAFAHAARLPADELPSGTPERIADALLESPAKRLDSEPMASPAVLRSMLTADPSAGPSTISDIHA